MRGSPFVAAVLVVMLAGPGVQVQAQPANNTPLTFGMNPQEASLALGARLIYVRGRPGNEMFLALPNVKGSALSDRRDGLICSSGTAGSTAGKAIGGRAGHVAADRLA